MQPMLTELELENYRCFKHVKVELAPLTVFVGPNASGKSSLLRAAACHGIGGQRDVRMHAPETRCRLRWRDDSAEEAVLKFTGNQRAGAGRQGGLYLHLDARRVRQPIQLTDESKLASDGANLANVFFTFPRRTQEQIARELSSLVPVINDVTPRPTSSGQHRLVFQDRWDSSVWYEPEDISDGTLLVLALLVVQHLPAPLRLVAIEEPEHGLHPYLLGEMVALLRRLSLGEAGPRPIQIVLATQSAELLNHLEPSEVRFLNRNAEDGSVDVEAAKTDSENWQKAYEAHQESLSSLWMSGTAGGVPG
jgi:predicted ATPase